MHEEHVDVINIKIPKGDLQGLGGIVVPFAPELRYHSNFRAREAALAYSAAHDVFDVISLGCVNEAVSILEGVDYRGFDVSFVLFAKAWRGQFVAFLVGGELKRLTLPGPEANGGDRRACLPMSWAVLVRDQVALTII